jgi:thioredoxin reductase
MIKYTNIIIGAGPAGIQLGYYFKEQNIEYIILEKTEICGSFFSRFPLSSKLISINKKYTGSDKPDFNLRHDWNSLISDKKDLLFTNYSNDYYPDSDDLVKYLNDYAKINELNIKYGINVKKVKKGENDSYSLITVDKDNNTVEYKCDKLIVATGLSKPVKPNMSLNIIRDIKHYGEYEKDYFKKPENLDKFKNKSLLIFGNGNAAYELGNLLNSYCSTISIIGRGTKEWAMSSHYTGDIRSTYIPFMDTFLLKSLNSIDVVQFDQDSRFQIEQQTGEDKYNLSLVCKDNNCLVRHPFYVDTIDGFDHIILCTGWKFDTSIFDFKINLAKKDKYPEILPHYESSNNKNLYFVGSLMHSLDFKKSSGGFIHGFRYLIKNFVNINYDISFKIDVFADNIIENVVKKIIDKINNTSPMYQMYGQICDFFYLDHKENEIIYYNDVNISFVLNGYFPMNTDKFFIMSLDYGTKTVTDIYEFGKFIPSVGQESTGSLLHPTLKVYNYDERYLIDNPDKKNSAHPLLIDEIHFNENLLANFNGFSKYYNKLYRALKMFL